MPDVSMYASDISVGGNVIGFQSQGNISVTTVNISNPNDSSRLKTSISGWLEAPHPATILNHLQTLHHDGTGEWILQSDEFRNFMDVTNPSNILWLKGKPGNGKSVLCSSIISNLRKNSQPRRPLLYFFFNFREDSTQSCDKFLKSLLTQLLHFTTSIPSPIENLYRSHHYGADPPSIKDMTTCFIDAVNTFEEVKLFVDAFDECSDWMNLRWFLETISGNKSLPLRLLFTSRPEEAIRDSATFIKIPSIDLTCRGMDGDIAKFVTDTLDRHPTRFTDEAKWLIQETLIRKANGMFRWVALQLDALLHVGTMEGLHTTLSSLPDTLDDTYTRILNKVPTIKRPHLRRILQWVCFSERPVRLEELATVYYIGDNIRPPFGTSNLLFRNEHILDLCPGLLSSVAVKLPSRGTYGNWHHFQGDATFQIVQLAHFSVKEYLSSPLAGTWRIEEEQSQISIVKTSIAHYLDYLNFKNIHLRQQITQGHYRSTMY